MDHGDFVRVIGGEGIDADYLPVACLLRAGYGCAGFYNRSLNESLSQTVVLVNAHVIALQEDRGLSKASIANFAEFIEEVVQRSYAGIQPHSQQGPAVEPSEYGTVIPLAAIPLNEISVVYPVAKIQEMTRRLCEGKPQPTVPAFLDFQNRSEILKVLRTKLW